MYASPVPAPATLSTVISLFAASPNYAAVLEGEELRVRWMNARFLSCLRQTFAAVEGGSLGDFLACRELIPYLQRARASGRPQPFSQLHNRSSPGDRWLTGVATPMDRFVVVHAYDSTSEVRAMELGSLADQMLEQIPFPVLLLSEGGEAVRINNRARTRLGLALGMDMQAIADAVEIEDDHGRRIDSSGICIERGLAGESIELRGSVRDRLLGERRDCVILGGPVRTQNGVAAMLLTAFDVTDLRKAERAKDEFINVAGHELKTPLTAAKTYLQLAARRGLDDPKAGVMIESALDALQRMHRLINDMLDTERLETGRIELRLERRDLCAPIRDYVERKRRELAGGRLIELDLHGPLDVEHDPLRIEQVLGNLVSNALRYSSTDQPVRIVARAEKGYAVVEVDDRGEGIGPDEELLVFDRLYRGRKSTGDGLGLGLFIAKLLVELHGGKIGVSPRPGGGTRFFFSIPLADLLYL
ncbi:sensor histidine kinase [Vulgatibacter incomptus]|uniref:histidine kinase n=1 Tax=Vulgatibacter incomptus TaxID=1391653 RepID=A0A0K1PHR7_9BACT|nr:ATP-binding protein [Vulgatibacter incomptus]AKU93083.1 Two-component sensor histidine kinase [Vulgatibacter incomptus]